MQSIIETKTMAHAQKRNTNIQQKRVLFEKLCSVQISVKLLIKGSKRKSS